jgi:hypothetical protein
MNREHTHWRSPRLDPQHSQGPNSSTPELMRVSEAFYVYQQPPLTQNYPAHAEGRQNGSCPPFALFYQSRARYAFHIPARQEVTC